LPPSQPHWVQQAWDQTLKWIREQGNLVGARLREGLRAVLLFSSFGAAGQEGAGWARPLLALGAGRGSQVTNGQETGKWDIPATGTHPAEMKRPSGGNLSHQDPPT
jgi:hypothetical protein